MLTQRRKLAVALSMTLILYSSTATAAEPYDCAGCITQGYDACADFLSTACSRVVGNPQTTSWIAASDWTEIGDVTCDACDCEEGHPNGKSALVYSKTTGKTGAFTVGGAITGSAKVEIGNKLLGGVEASTEVQISGDKTWQWNTLKTITVSVDCECTPNSKRRCQMYVKPKTKSATVTTTFTETVYWYHTIPDPTELHPFDHHGTTPCPTGGHVRVGTKNRTDSASNTSYDNAAYWTPFADLACDQ